MLEVRLRTGLAAGVLDDAEREQAVALTAEGLLTEADGSFVLTLRGRLLADLVVRRLTG